MAGRSTKSQKSAAKPKKQPKNKGGRPAFQATQERRQTVKAMAGYGIPQVDIARALGISERTLRNKFRAELTTGSIVATSKVAENLFKIATSKDHKSAVSAAIFWLKARAGWKETSKHELGGPDGGPIPVTSPLDELARRIDDMANRRRPPEDTEGSD